MELQLGLALASTPMKMFDLNCYGYEPREGLGSNTLSVSRSLLKLGPSDINIHNSSISSSSSSGSVGSRKRCFDEELRFDESRIVPKTLPLLLWSNQPNDGDDPKDLEDNSSSAIFKNNGKGLVGWPPVKIWRKKLRREIANGGAADNNNRVEAVAMAENGCGGRASISTYVKVKMEGVGIARKIDLSVHHSFETLTTTLMRMFGISDENWKSCKLTYQDKEGDWLLAEDIPWRTFVRSLKCLKIIRSRG